MHLHTVCNDEHARTHNIHNSMCRQVMTTSWLLKRFCNKFVKLSCLWMHSSSGTLVYVYSTFAQLGLVRWIQNLRPIITIWKAHVVNRDEPGAMGNECTGTPQKWGINGRPGCDGYEKLGMVLALEKKTENKKISERLPRWRSEIGRPILKSRKMIRRDMKSLEGIGHWQKKKWPHNTMKVRNVYRTFWPRQTWTRKQNGKGFCKSRGTVKREKRTLCPSLTSMPSASLDKTGE